MASWVIHFRVADALLDRFPELSATEFVFGNIAPDSGVPNEDNTSFTPPKSVSHFHYEYNGHMLSGWQEYSEKYLSSAKLQGYKSEELAFHLGYFSHLYTDYMWSLNVGLPSIERDSESYQRGKSAAVWKWKVDWYDLDFRYLRDHPDFRAFRIYRDAPEFKNIYLDFYPSDAFDLRRKHITDFYSEKRENLDRKYLWLTPKQADEFVTNTVETVTSELVRFL